jgi:hypothetical protein
MLAKVASLLLLLALCAFIAPAGSPPTFTNPTAITNPWAPFVPGSVKIFRGHDDGARTARVESCLSETRSFAWGGGAVECRILQEQDFEDGALVELSLTWLAQDDAGEVQTLGEVSWTVSGGTLGDPEGDSWLVGGATQPSDPPNALNVADPRLVMSADPQPGDVFVSPAWPSGNETTTVLAKVSNVRVPAGKYTQALLVQELDDGEDGTQPAEKHWIVPGVGVVKESWKQGHDELLATSLVEAAAP